MEERDYAFYMSWLHRLIYNFAWPPYECEQCVGQEPQHGCYCAHYDCVAPNVPPMPWHLWARRLWSVIARRCGMMDPGRKW